MKKGIIIGIGIQIILQYTALWNIFLFTFLLCLSNNSTYTLPI
jgi:hypothetical protein